MILNQKKTRILVMIAILALGFLLRVWGIDWGLPERLDLHPDEHDYIMKHALALSWANPDPGWYNYPAFLMYLISLTWGALGHLGLAQADWQAYLIGRLWSAFFSTAIAWAVYRLARECRGGPSASLLAALWAVLLPLTVWEGHMAITDPMMTFWPILTLWASARLVRTGRWADYTLAGACLGLATGSKYTAALAAVAILAGAFVARRPIGKTLTGLALAALVSIACAFVVMPYSFVRFNAVLTAMAYERQHTLHGNVGFTVPADGWQYHRYLYQLVAAWPFSLGFVLYASAGAGTLWAILQRDRPKWVVLAFMLVFFGVTGSWHFIPLRYSMPICVIGALFAGLWHGALLDNKSAVVRNVGGALVAATFAYTFLFSAQTANRFAHETRMEAGRWLTQTLQPDTSMLICGSKHYCALPAKDTPCRIDGSNEGAVRRLGADDSHDLIQITSLHFERHYRYVNHNRIWLDAYDNLRRHEDAFERVARFDSHFINKSLYMKLDPMFGGYFISPRLEFYRPRHPDMAAQTPSDTSRHP